MVLKKEGRRYFSLISDISGREVEFRISNYIPRRNPYEKGLKYRLCVGSRDENGSLSWYDTGMRGSTLEQCRAFAFREWARWF